MQWQRLQTGAQLVLGLAVLIVLVLAGWPRSWRIERSIVVNAPRERIHALLDDLRAWSTWGPWSKEQDPHARYSYEGPERGVGAKRRWLGPKLGQGSLELTQSSAEQGVTATLALEGEEPNARLQVGLSVEPGGTRVTWTDEGTLPLMAGVFRSRHEERLVTAIDRSLGALKAQAEHPSAP